MSPDREISLRPRAARARVVAGAGGAFALAVGITTLLGYALDLRRLTDWDNDGISMFPNAAMCSALSGAAICLMATTQGRASWRTGVRAMAVAVGLVGGLTLFEHFVSVNLGIDTLLFERSWGQRAAMAPMRMGPPASTSYLIIGAALLLLTYGPRARGFAAVLGVFAVIIAMLSLVGYWLGSDHLFGVAKFTGIALQTSSAIFAVGIALIALVPESGPSELLGRDDPGGLIVRRLALPIVVVPLLLEWFRLTGLEGGYFDIAFGSAMLALLTILMLIALLTHTAEGLTRHARLSRAAEDDLRNLTASLETRVAQRTAELELQTMRLRRLATELSRVEQSERKRLAALLHDELQQSLVAAKMVLASAKKLSTDATVAEIEKASDMIGDAIESSRNLTGQLRPPALYEGGLLPALEGLASETERRYRIPVSFSAFGDMPRLSDELNAQLFDCVRELLLNAAKHSGTDGVKVDVGMRDRALHLSVSDKGKGFEAEAQTIQRSNGFGLFSIKERLAAIEGTIKIESHAGDGCRVELIVPVSEIPRVRARSDALIPGTAGVDEEPSGAEINSRCRVVIADDHQIVREGIAKMLNQESKIRVIAQVSDGIEVIEVVERLRPDVVLLDVNMPRMNGIEAAREIHYRWPRIAIIGLSIHDDEATIGAMLDAGALMYISKSDHPNMIASAILGLAVVDDVVTAVDQPRAAS